MFTIFLILIFFLANAGAYLNAHYVFYQDSGSVPFDTKFLFGNKYVDFEYKGVDINESTCVGQGIEGITWLQAGVLEPGHVYLLKSYAEEIHKTPFEIPTMNSTYTRFLPGLLDEGAEITIRAKFTGTWDTIKFKISIDDDNKAFRMYLKKKDTHCAHFDIMVNKTVQGAESKCDLSPFLTEEEITLSFIVKQGCTQVQVNHEDYYCYTRQSNLVDSEKFVIWNSGGFVSIYSYSMLCPPLII